MRSTLFIFSLELSQCCMALYCWIVAIFDFDCVRSRKIGYAVVNRSMVGIAQPARFAALCVFLLVVRSLYGAQSYEIGPKQVHM